MPTPQDGETEEQFVERCIPIVLEDGTADGQEQAVAVCHSLFADAGKSIASLVSFGGELKALGDGKVGGYLIRFTKQGDYDLTQERFAPETDYGDRENVPVFYQHGLDRTVGKRILAKAELRRDEFGIWAETQLALRDEYEKFIYAQTEKGKMGWSSGVPSHLVEKEGDGEGKGWVIKMWHIAEASITPTPAEPRNSVIPIKALSPTDPKAEPEAALTNGAAQATVTASDAETQVPTKSAAQSAKENQEMAELDQILDAVTQTSSDVKTFVTRLEAVEAALKKEPPTNGAATQIVVTEDPADRPFKTLAEQCLAVRQYELSKGRETHPRIKGLNFKATGAGEVVPSDGGILLDPTLTNDLISHVHDTGVFSSKVRRLPVSNNSNSGWINGVNETTRVNGSRWGGVQGYRLAEAGSITASKPTFRRINWELKKYGVMVYGTDELLADATQWSEIVNTACREELAFMVNDDIMNGIGVSGALGFMNSGALITVTRDTGSAILSTDITAMWNRLDPAYRANAEWYIGNDSQPQLDKLYFTGSTSVLSPFYGYTPAGVLTMYGRPVNVTEFNASLNTTGDIVLADLSQYLFWEKSDVQAATSIHVAFTTDESVFRFIYRADGKSAFASALTPYKGSTTTSPFVVLGSAT